MNLQQNPGGFLRPSLEQPTPIPASVPVKQEPAQPVAHAQVAEPAQPVAHAQVAEPAKPADLASTIANVEQGVQVAETVSSAVQTAVSDVQSAGGLKGVFEEIGSKIKEGAETVEQDVVSVVKSPAKAIKLLHTVLQDYPQLKSQFVTLMTLGTATFGDGALAVGAKGLNWAEDISTVESVQAFAAYFMQTLLPTLEAVAGQLNAESK